MPNVVIFSCKGEFFHSIHKYLSLRLRRHLLFFHPPPGLDESVNPVSFLLAIWF